MDGDGGSVGGDKDSGDSGHSCVLGGKSDAGTVSGGSSRLRRAPSGEIVLVLLGLFQGCWRSEGEGGGGGECERVEDGGVAAGDGGSSNDNGGEQRRLWRRNCQWRK